MAMSPKEANAKRPGSDAVRGASGRFDDLMGRRSILILCVAIACFFYWVSLPPLRQPWAAFLSAFFFSAAVGWPGQLGRGDYLRVWLISSVVWLALLHGIRLAFWPLYFGWIALSLYIAVYIPLFLASSRALYRGVGLPIPFTCAIAWTGFELFRAYFITGFSACMLGHSQTPWPSMLHIASSFGTYGISFMIMLVGATVFFGIRELYDRWQCGESSIRWVDRFGLRAGLILTFLWLTYSLQATYLYDGKLKAMEPVKTMGRFLVVQHNMTTVFDSNIEDIQRSWLEYAKLTRQQLALSDREPIDVVLWPESAFGGGNSWWDWDGSTVVPDGETTIQQMQENKEAFDRSFMERVDLVLDRFPKVTMVAGGGVFSIRDGSIKPYNAAYRFSLEKHEPDYYAKQHLVMFGEYIPFIGPLIESFGFSGTAAGDKHVCWTTESGIAMAPSICFEDVVPHFMQRQVYELTRRGESPDLLVNLTNDAWFRGSSILDHHLNNAICTAVENRRPMLVAANSGKSAWIDGNGRVIRSLDRFVAGAFIAQPIPDGRKGLWQQIGDIPAKLLCALTLIPGVQWIVNRVRSRRKS
jgi:apolipoprotein N-acyltransferase